ncbi:Oidioi.mRNA.OKI2018_I69.chr2.g5427.t1.cds [Oikopleura dioica]|uniref:Oidioi.mRNA.OKI2018_I69.chr2.g5427.t1.cds n=1 Tax=Oikopleura dioica TaxID=34765 RepID=A0ABN7T0T8_OIKDI|nr:Oidioi.mRNA.OKI2018_I69.chr2.g5427.t1.cds [Oikopleura dioica]
MRTLQIAAVNLLAVQSQMSDSDIGSYDASYYMDNYYDYYYDDVDEFGERKKKKKKKQQNKNKVNYYEELPSYLNGKDEYGEIDETMGHNGHQCWKCHSASYEECVSEGYYVNCKDEQYHCDIRENRHFGNVTKVHMGCKQSKACLAEFEQNDKFYGRDLPKVMGFNFFFGQTEDQPGPYHQCFPANSTIEVSICRQCCTDNKCNYNWTDGSLDTEQEWNDKTNHPLLEEDDEEEEA